MKARSIVYVLALLCLVTALTAAKASEAVVSPQGTEMLTGGEATKVEISGSYVPSIIRRIGRITTGSDNLVIIDRQEIETSGASDVAQLLLRDPSIRIRRR